MSRFKDTYLLQHNTDFTNYYRHAVSKKIFTKLDHAIIGALIKWAKRRHQNKGMRWVVKKYFRSDKNRHWVFAAQKKLKDGTSELIELFSAAQIPIVRFTKVRADAHPYDPIYTAYFEARKGNKLRNSRKPTDLPLADIKGLLAKQRREANRRP